jgi:hypothetical protein
MTTSDPERWLESVQAPLALPEREALRALSLRGPDHGARVRMLERLEQMTSGTLAPASGQAPEIRDRLSWGWIVAGSLALLLLAAVIFRPAPSRPAAPLRKASSQQIAAPIAAPERNSAPEAAAQPLPNSARVPAQAGASRIARMPSRRAQPIEAARDPGAELALLTPARQLLAVDPARTLTLADEHASRFPRGVFCEERAFLRIEALVRLGERSAAELDARAFVRAHPASTYQERLKQLLSAAR